MNEIWDFLRQVIPTEVKEYYWLASAVLTSWWFWTGVVVILALERLRPAVPPRPIFRRAVAEDSIWLNIELATRAILVPAVTAFTAMGYNAVTGGASLAFAAGWPMWTRVALSLVIFDLVEYLNHWVRHQVPFLWRFHTIHHSQRDLNLFSASRTHVAEYVVVTISITVPMLAFGLTPFAVMGTGMAIGLHARLVHANIRSDFGPLGLIFVSPHFHRVHHSIEPEHRNKNLGLVLSVWDRLFGTFAPTRDYPRTGVTDADFSPASATPVAIGRSVVQALVYPFRRKPSADRPVIHEGSVVISLRRGAVPPEQGS
jgi:sterol desaturase/sphingolipid hydroxylase (fatty acid hydroxylase superfamily)